jgi:hypothetical protein
MNVCLEGGPFLYRFQLVSLLCYSIVDIGGGRGLLRQYPLAGGLKRAVLLAPSRALCYDGKQCLVFERGAETGAREREGDELHGNTEK